MQALLPASAIPDSSIREAPLSSGAATLWPTPLQKVHQSRATQAPEPLRSAQAPRTFCPQVLIYDVSNEAGQLPPGRALTMHDNCIYRAG